jgi:outer membrane protein assembly factor BamB
MVAFDRSSFTDVLLDSMLAEGVSVTEPREAVGRLAVRDMPGDVKAYDYFHLNTITLLPDTPLGRKDARFRAGNILTCARNVNQIAILDSSDFEILWVWGQGTLQWPHHPTMLDNGNILVFDNGVVRKYSSVLEIDPVTGAVEWQYVATPPQSFYTVRNGSAQRLPNGNTLICEGMRGRTFEVTREGEIVWEWLNAMAEDRHRFSLYRMVRLSPATVEPLLGQ